MRTINSSWASQVVLVVKNLIASAVVKISSRPERCGFDPWIGKVPWRRKWQPAPVFFPGKSHGQRSQAGYSPWGREESDMTEHTHRDLITGITAGQCVLWTENSDFSMSPKNKSLFYWIPLVHHSYLFIRLSNRKKVVKEVLFTVYKLNLPVNNSFLLITLPDFPSLNWQRT